MTVEWWLGYLLTTFILSLSPGSGAVNTMSTAISYGYRGALASVAGLQAGLVLQILIVGVGLGTLFAHSPLAFNVLKWLGAAWLVWLGLQQWRAAGAIDLQALSAQARRHLFRRAMLVNVTNPKSLVFLAALFPQFILPHQPQAAQYLVLGLTSVLVDIVVMGAGYASLARHLARWLKGERQMKLLNRVFGTLFILIALLLAGAHLQ